MPLSRLTALSPLDGRYADKVEALSGYFSESALIRYRVAVEVEYLLALLDRLGHPAARDADIAETLRRAYRNFGVEQAAEVKELERTTRHDVKAVEYWLKRRVAEIPALAGELELIHLGLTSEDVNNLAYALMHRDALMDVVLPGLERLLVDLVARTRRHRAQPMLARTHGQPASPTTMGKELGVFAARLAGEVETLTKLELRGKLGGATGTFAALSVAYPSHDWLAFGRRFVTGFGLAFAPVTTQIEPCDAYAALYDSLRRVDQILLDLCQDMWQYVSLGFFKQRIVEGEVGSSAMPHKVNPIDFENAEGNLGLANALFAHLGSKLQVSRMQRDLSGSTVMRNAGVAFGHMLLAWQSIGQGLSRSEVDGARLDADLAAHPEVLAEAIQTVLRAQGGAVPYERLKAMTRGKTVTLDELLATARELAPVRADLWPGLLPATYIGIAPQLADEAAGLAESAIARSTARRTPQYPFSPRFTE